jgi:ribonuclease D
MSEQQDEVSPEIRALIEEKAEEHGVPVELLVEIYREERRVVNMDLRQNIHTNIQDLIEEYGDDWSPTDS